MQYQFNFIQITLLKCFLKIKTYLIKFLICWKAKNNQKFALLWWRRQTNLQTTKLWIMLNLSSEEC